MTDDFRMHRYTDADGPGVYELLRVAFSDQYASHMRQTWDWKYDSHPLNRESEQVRRTYQAKVWPLTIKTTTEEQRALWGLNLDELNAVPEDAPYVLILKDGSKVVAMEGSLPQAFHVNGTRHLISVGCDFCVHPEYRGHSLSLRLATRVMMDHRMSLGWYGDTSKMLGDSWQKRFEPTLADRPKNKQGYPPGTGTTRVVAMVKPIDWSYMVRRTTGFHLPKRVAALAAAGVNRVSSVLAKPIAMPRTDVFQLECFDERIDDLWERCSREHEVIGVRDSSYLNWRFNSRPDASYVCLAAARGSQLIGYLVYRIVEREGGRWGYIVDFLTEGATKAAFALLVAQAEERMAQAGVQSIVCFIAKAPYRKVLRQAGFYPSIAGERSYMAGVVRMPDERMIVFGDLDKWFVTMADGDAEMIF